MNGTDLALELPTVGGDGCTSNTVRGKKGCARGYVSLCEVTVAAIFLAWGHAEAATKDGSSLQEDQASEVRLEVQSLSTCPLLNGSAKRAKSRSLSCSSSSTRGRCWCSL